MPKLSEQAMFEEEQLERELDRCLGFLDKMLAFAGKRRSGPGSKKAICQFLPKPHMMRHICPTIMKRSDCLEDDAAAIRGTPGLMRLFETESFIAHPNLSRLPLAAEYLTGTMYGLEVECFHMLCLDKSGRLKENVLLNKGVYDASIFSLRLMLEEIERVKPDCIILCHNHPGGTTRPSHEDLDCTAEAMYALTAKGIPMLDHIIVSNETAVSLRAHGFIPEKFWQNQKHGHTMLENWLSEENLPDRLKNRLSESYLFREDGTLIGEDKPEK